MKSFHVLDRFQDIRKSLFIEASAGTGKTFCIENIVVRLLLEDPPLSLEEIVVLTFTRAAARELKLRIHQKITEAIGILKRALSENPPEQVPDYLKKIAETDPRGIKHSLRRLERALCFFDLAEIGTIHSFAAKMLAELSPEGLDGLKEDVDKQVFGQEEMKAVIQDFFRGGYLQRQFSQAEIRALMELFSGDLESLVNSVVQTLSTGIAIIPVPCKEQQRRHFQKALRELKRAYNLSKEGILCDFSALAPLYKGNCTKNGEIHPILWDKAERFACLFSEAASEDDAYDFIVEDKLSLARALDAGNLKARLPKNAYEGVQHAQLGGIIEKHLGQFADPSILFARLSAACKEVVDGYKASHQLYGYDDLLRKLLAALDAPDFFSKAFAKYQAAIIDEFQDTDPLQWKIFQQLFLSKQQERRLLYLVGDPKQSIYSFRQADIYTYLAACEQFQGDSLYSLDTNFRSQPPLTQALNALFCQEHSPDLFSLPKRGASMRFLEVQSPQEKPVVHFLDNKGAVHFFIAQECEAKTYSLPTVEQEYLLPFIAKEILYLVEHEKVSFNQIAILIADRFQAERVAEKLALCGIPAIKQRAQSLIHTDAAFALKEFLLALADPANEGLLKIALGGKLIRWEQTEVEKLQEMPVHAASLYQLYCLQRDFSSGGFAGFFQKFLASRWKEDGLSLMERLLVEEGGEEDFQDLHKIADFILRQESSLLSRPDKLANYVEHLQGLPETAEELPKKQADPAKNSVQIMTLHASKGLEFAVVFSLGTLQRKKSEPLLFPAEYSEETVLLPVGDKKSPAYHDYLLELDAEKVRQLYVAWTRAKLRLYIPAIFVEGVKAPEMGACSAMDLFLARFGSAFFQKLEDLGKRFSISFSLLDRDELPLRRHEEREEVALEEPQELTVPQQPLFIHSFSTIAAKSFSLEAAKSSGDPPHDFTAAVKNAHTLPAGRETGNLLHACLQNLSFEACRGYALEEELIPYVRSYTVNTPYDPWCEVVAAILFRVMKKPLKEGFALCEVADEEAFREGEFLYASESALFPGFVKGFFDLFFHFKGKYYLLDWKTNWLGPASDHYKPCEMAAAMEKNGYVVQADLYRQAIVKYLALVDKRPFHEIFGGVYYIFVRGVGKEADSGNGIFQVRS